MAEQERLQLIPGDVLRTEPYHAYWDVLGMRSIGNGIEYLIKLRDGPLPSFWCTLAAIERYGMKKQAS